jgi:hypothetical protein
MNDSHFSIIICAGLLLLPGPALAQLPATKPQASLENAADGNKSVAKADADRLAKERREQARSLLISLASDARSFRDQPLRARSLGRIADTLWDVDAERGRTLFRQAWEAAEIGDRESQDPLNLRQQILALAVKHDRLLAEQFLEKLKTDQKDPDAADARDDYALSDALQQRLKLAASLVRTGDTEGALQFADPLLGSVTLSTVDFLTLLREKNPGAADKRYAAMLANTSGNILADGNTISLLSSYLFTPHMYVIFNTDGSPGWTMPGSFFPPANVDPQLHLAFFQTAKGVLLRSQPQPESDPSMAGIAGKYMVVKRLMPLFEQYAPREITEAMRGQFEALNNLVNDSLRQGEKEWVQKGISPEKSTADQEQSLLDQIEHVKTSDERDQLYFKLALLALSHDDTKARDFANRIEESWIRKLAQGWVDWSLALEAIKKKTVEKALDLARKGELTHIERVWILTQSAKLLAKTDRDRALSVLDDAISESRRIENVDFNRPRGLLAIANALELIEPARVWDAIFDAVKAANSAEGFTGEDDVITVSINAKAQTLKKTDANPDFEIKGIFGEVSNKDFNRAVQLARGFEGEAPRANATIAICRSVLNEKSNSAPAPQPAAVKSPGLQ